MINKRMLFGFLCAINLCGGIMYGAGAAPANAVPGHLCFGSRCTHNAIRNVEIAIRQENVERLIVNQVERPLVVFASAGCTAGAVAVLRGSSAVGAINAGLCGGAAVAYAAHNLVGRNWNTP